MPNAEIDLTRMDFNGMEKILEGIFQEGYTMQDFAQLTDQEVEAAYAMACQLINQQQWQKAEKTFEFLCHMNHYDGRFWLGLGLCRQQRKEFEGAAKAYAIAGFHDMENPIPALRAAECFLTLGKLDEAESGVTAALHWAGQKPQFAAVRSRAELLKQGIQEQRKAKS